MIAPSNTRDDPADTPDTFQGRLHWRHRRHVCPKVGSSVTTCLPASTAARDEGRGAIFLWNESQECIVERNVSYRLRLRHLPREPLSARATRWHDDRCIVRNNFVTRCGETGILTAHTRHCLVVHNTVHDPASSLRRLLWVQDDNEGLFVANNLLSGPDVLNTGSSHVALQDNLAIPDLTDQFGRCGGRQSAHGRRRPRRASAFACRKHSRTSTVTNGAERPHAGAQRSAYRSITRTSPAPRPAPDGNASGSPPTQSWVAAMAKVHSRF